MPPSVSASHSAINSLSSPYALRSRSKSLPGRYSGSPRAKAEAPRCGDSADAKSPATRAESTPPTRVASLRTRPIERLQQYRARVAGIGAPTRVANRRGKEFFERRVARFAVEASRLRGIDAFRRVLRTPARSSSSRSYAYRQMHALLFGSPSEGDVGRRGRRARRRGEARRTPGRANLAMRPRAAVSRSIRDAASSNTAAWVRPSICTRAMSSSVYRAANASGSGSGSGGRTREGARRPRRRRRRPRVRPAPTLAIRGLVLVRDVSLVVRVGPAERAGGGGGGDGGGRSRDDDVASRVRRECGRRRGARRNDGGVRPPRAPPRAPPREPRAPCAERRRARDRAPREPPRVVETPNANLRKARARRKNARRARARETRASGATRDVEETTLKLPIAETVRGFARPRAPRERVCQGDRRKATTNAETESSLPFLRALPGRIAQRLSERPTVVERARRAELRPAVSFRETTLSRARGRRLSTATAPRSRQLTPSLPHVVVLPNSDLRQPHQICLVRLGHLEAKETVRRTRGRLLPRACRISPRSRPAGTWYPPSATSTRFASSVSSRYGYSGSSNKPQIQSPALRSFGSCRESSEGRETTGRSQRARRRSRLVETRTRTQGPGRRLRGSNRAPLRASSGASPSATRIPSGSSTI